MYIFSLSLFIPELIVLGLVFVITLLGAYTKHNFRQVRILAIMMMVGFLASISYIWGDFYNVSILFNDDLQLGSLSSLLRILVLISGIVTLLMMMLGRKEVTSQFQFESIVLLALSVLGMMVFIGANNYLILYLGLELMSLPLYVLVAINRNGSKASEAGIKYFVLGALASGLMLFGISLYYGVTGTIAFDAAVMGQNHLILLFGQVLILVAVLFKASAAPFHMWAPDVYEGASTTTVAFIASASKVAVVGVMIKLLTIWYGYSAAWHNIIMFVAVLSLIVGSFGALLQRNIKRLLAYSSISHMGFVLLGFVAINNDLFLVAVLKYLLIYLVMTFGVFMLLQNCKLSSAYKGEIAQLAGLGKQQPFLAFAMAVLMFSMAGIPPLMGFFAKLYILLPLLESGYYTLCVIAIVASVISAFYYLNIIKVMYFDDEKYQFNFKTNIAYTAVLLLIVLINIIYFIAPDFFIQPALWPMHSN